MLNGKNMKKIKCPCCENYFKLIKRNGDYIAVPFLDNNYSPTHDELEKLGIEFGVEMKEVRRNK